MVAALRGSFPQILFRPHKPLGTRSSATIPYPNPVIREICSISVQPRTGRRPASFLTATSRVSRGPNAASVVGRPPIWLPFQAAVSTAWATTTTTTTARFKRALTYASVTATGRTAEAEPETGGEMASSSDQNDQEYMAFLDRANEDPSKGAVEGQGLSQGQSRKFRTTQEGVGVPAPLARVCQEDGAFYVSDADEPFEAVALAWDEAGKGLPDEGEFAALIEHWDPKNAEIEILDPVDWDRNGQYSGIVDAVREAGRGNDVRVYRVARGGVRAEYWVVTTEGKGKGAKLVGVKALAVES